MTDEAEESAIGARLRGARERRGWTREALAFHSGLSWSAIAQVESGRRRNLRPATLSALATALNVSIDYLVDGYRTTPALVEHHALRYGSDSEFVGVTGAFLAAAVDRSEPALAVTTATNIALLREDLGDDARHVEFADSAAWYGDPVSTLEAYRRFSTAKLNAGAAWVRIVGEPVWHGRDESEITRWVRYESLLNLVFANFPTSFICPYDERTVDAAVLRNAARTHPSTYGLHGVSPSDDYVAPDTLALEG